jgi:hypothetical protein
MLFNRLPLRTNAIYQAHVDGVFDPDAPQFDCYAIVDAGDGRQGLALVCTALGEIYPNMTTPVDVYLHALKACIGVIHPMDRVHG